MTDTNPYGITYELALRSIQRSQYCTDLKRELKVQIWQDMHPFTLMRQAEEEIWRFESGTSKSSEALGDLVKWASRHLNDPRGFCRIGILRPRTVSVSDHMWLSASARVFQFNNILAAERKIQGTTKGPE